MTRKIILLLSLTLLVGVCSGCDLPAFQGRMATVEQANRESAENLTEKLVPLLNQKDVQGIKELFCPITKSKFTNLESNITVLCNALPSEITEYEISYPAGTGHLENGEYKSSDISFSICIPKYSPDDEEIDYKIAIRYRPVYEEEPKFEGLNTLSLLKKDSDKEVVTVGHYWVYYSGNLAEVYPQVVSAYGEKDVQKIMKLFTSDKQNSEATAAALKKSFEGFKGEPIYGRTENIWGKEYFDGRLDYQVSIEEDAIVENNKVISTTAVVHLTNIRTSEGEVYKMDISAICDETEPLHPTERKFYITSILFNGITID